MILDYEPGDKVTNPQKKEWGIGQVQSIINDINRAQLEIGSFESKKHNLLHHVAQSQEKLGEMQGEFEKNYGTADINIQDGTINYQKEDGKTD